MSMDETEDEAAIEELNGTLNELIAYLEKEAKVEEAMAKQAVENGSEIPPRKMGHLRLVK